MFAIKFFGRITFYKEVSAIHCENSDIISNIRFFHLVLIELVYEPVLPHELIRINIKNKINNYNYLSHSSIKYSNTHSSIKYSNTYSKIYIYHYLVTIDFVLHHTFICIWYIFSWTICLRIGILISSIYIMGIIFI